MAILWGLGGPAAHAGDFQIDWEAFDWPAGVTGPLVRTLRDQNGFEVDVTVTHTGPFAGYPDGAGGTIPTPDDVTIFGGSTESLILVVDAPQNQGAIGDSRTISTVSASSGGIAILVDDLTIDVFDIDSTDNNAVSDRCDFLTVFGDNGNPTLSTLSLTPSVVVGPGFGSGLTGPITANQAQCIYFEGPTGSPTSPNDDTGSVRATFPDATSSVTFWYDESIQNVRNYNVFTTYDPGARGLGMFGNANFTVDQSISLARSVTPISGLQGDTVTYSYTVTNNGELPFNIGQDVVIEDDLLGSVTCPAITAPIAPGGTVTCTAPYTISALDVLTGTVNSTATAGIGAIGQAFSARLQSNSQSLSLVTSVLSGDSGAQNCTPQSVFAHTRSQLAGPGSAAALTTSDIFLFDDVTEDVNGNAIDVVFQLDQISNASAVKLEGSLQALMTPSNNGYVTYRLRLVQDGTATPANPQGIAIEQSRINGVIVQQTDVDSRGSSDDSSDVVGPVSSPRAISYLNTAPLVAFPAPGQAIAMDPAKQGDPSNWIDEPNETNFDNYATYEYDTFIEGAFIHGFTGSSTNPATRGSGILLCGIVNSSADVIARDDDYTASPLNSLLGGTAGEVLVNDTINALPALFPTATLEVLTPAVPQNDGDPVPVLETSGVDAGRVIVPPGVPAGTYTIDYRLCDSLTPGDCDRAKVTLAVFDGLGLDFGDAPVTYLVAAHAVRPSPTIYLGSVAPDIEIVAQSDATATADDLIDNDDEDAILFPVMTQGAISTLNIPVTGAGVLQAWIDFNGDGVFEETLGERIASDLSDDGTGFDTVAGDGVIQVDVAVPTDATTATTYARFRYASTPGLPAAGFALDGEVEDYSLVIVAADLVDRGDAPASYGDPRHIVVPSIYLGAGLPDTEWVPQNSVTADADDLAGSDDEDAIALFPVLEAGTTQNLTVQTHETLSLQLALGLPVLSGITNLQLWVDWDQNGRFETSEQVAVNYRDGGAGDTDGVFNNQISLEIPVPGDIGNGISYARVRWSTTSIVGLEPFDGLNLDGEVEDYLVTLSNPNAPLVCDTGFYMIYESGAQPILEKLQISGSAGSYSTNGTTYPANFSGTYTMSGWGWNEVDNYIYGIFRNTFQLHRVTYSGAVQLVSDMSALGLEPVGTTLEILPNGVLIYNSQATTGRYQLVDISDPSAPTNLGVLEAGSSAPNGLDMAYNPRDGLLYMVANGNDIYALDPLGGVAGATSTVLVADNVTLPAGTGSYQLDSVWMDENGYFYAYDNVSQQIFALELGEAGDRPASFQFFKVDGTGSAQIGNDGASCRKGSFYASTVFAEGTISGRLYHDSNASGAYDVGESGLPADISMALYRDNATPADLTDDILVTTTQTDGDGRYVFAGVDATVTYRIEVNEADPEIPANRTISTPNPRIGVTVMTGAETSDQDFGFEATALQADLSLNKAAFDTSGAALSSAQDGAQIDFVLTVTNDGPATATDVRVRDLIPDGFTYVSNDAAAQAMGYDPSSGIWTLTDLPDGTSATLTLRVVMKATGTHTNTAEIVASAIPDPDSDPAVGTLRDDLSDGIVDDDEASATVSFIGMGPTLSGTVFRDNGAAGDTAYDGLQGAQEPGIPDATVTVADTVGTVLGQPVVAADGTWSLTLPEGFNSAVTVTLAPTSDGQVVSESPGTLPGLVNTQARDGSFGFTPVSGGTYSNLNFGVIPSARLRNSQQAAMRSGQVITLRHEYTAQAPGNVTFEIDVHQATMPGLFSTGIFLDPACNGTPITAVNGAQPITADTRICLVIRVTASSAASPGASIAFDLIADTTYGATGLSAQVRNTDVVRVDSSQGQLTLRKTVRNITQGTPEGVSNGAALGDVLEYRIYLDNPGTLPATQIVIHDRTPPYTTLAAPIPSSTAIGTDVICTLAVPSPNNAGYAGPLRWECAGTHPPGATGSVTFQVQIAP
ncbi:hypothetical protein BFP70_10535 [Thioclava sp. SK-1]|nr:hypothetical protein BFP70_10535 [Thioclava sp. SK-1]